jgi:DNA-directed RNA polymerase specialized sigma24 family protein
MIISSSIDLREETNIRLDRLYRGYNDWLEAVAYNISKDVNTSKELVAELYLYLGERPNPNLWYEDTYNLLYLKSFLHSRFINSIKRSKKMVRLYDDYEMADTEYNTDADERFESCWNDMINQLDKMKREKGWSAALLFEHYYFSDKTLEEVSEMIGISKSTTFLNTKRVKLHLKSILKNPFRPENE